MCEQSGVSVGAMSHKHERYESEWSKCVNEVKVWEEWSKCVNEVE